MSFLILLIYIISIDSKWIPCATEGDYCHLPGSQYSGELWMHYNDTFFLSPKYNQQRFLVSFGINGQMVYKEFGSENNAVYCSTKTFGNPTYGIYSDLKMCYYKIIDVVPLDYSQKIIIKDSFYLIPEGSIYMAGYTGTYMIGYFMGKIPKDPQVFGGDVTYFSNGITTNKPKNTDQFYSVYTNDLSKNYGKWYHCANEGYYCELPSEEHIYSIMFGVPTWYDGPSGNVRPSNIIKEYSGKKIHCSTVNFPNMITDKTDYNSNPRACMYSIKSYFSEPIGYWKQVISCNNCKTLTTTLTIGVTSQTSNSKSETWADNLQESTSSGLHFKLFSNTESLSKSTSHSITEASSHAFTQSTSRSCSASCNNDNGVVAMIMWQWMIDVIEICNSDNCNFQVFTCNFICRSDWAEPKCPLTRCVDAECTICLS